MENKILVIGAAGNVCLEVIKRLINKGENVRIAAKDPERAKAMNLQNAEIFPFDYTHPETHDPLFEGITKLLIVSPPAHLKIQNLVTSVLERAKADGVKYIVSISAMGVESDDHPLRIIENYIESLEVDYTILRPNCYMQNFSTYFCESIKEMNELRVPANSAKTSFVDLRDVADVATHILLNEDHKNMTFTLTGREALNLDQVASILSDVLKREIKYIPTTDDEYKMLMNVAGWTESTIDASLMLCHYVKQGWNATITYDIHTILGSDPISFQQFVKDHADVWKVVEPHNVL